MNYSIDNYGKTSAFASFLPGIAGIKGIPIWCYYVNRGQGVVSFGVDNKDHAIMEFYPAHMAYQNVKRTGFRTFIRRNGSFFEPFSNEHVNHAMSIEMNGLNICENNKDKGTKTEVSYFILPEEKVGALVRKVVITNLSDDAEYEILDGMPNVIPFGVGLDSMKNMTQTAKAWMQVEDHIEGKAYYRVRVSMADTASVEDIEAGNFAVAFDEKGQGLRTVVDPEAVFGYDLSLGYPAIFAEEGIDFVTEVKENISNLLPTAFFARKVTLKKGQSVVFYEMIGQVAKKELLHELLKTITGVEFFENKQQRAGQIADQLVKAVETKTASKEFDAYTSYTYMDNVLRGGLPIKLAGDKVFYVYSRKHGDLERDYNYFSMLPEFYSQGNGNFRDVNQNRRCDTFFADFVGKEGIHTFYDLIQLDGYNPLGIEKKTYTHKDFEKPFTPGQLYAKLLETSSEKEAAESFDRIMAEAEGAQTANFLEGYWSDHWTYNLDLVEEYLQLYPEKERELLYQEEYTYFLGQALINPRAKRYVKTEKGIRQYDYLDKAKARNTEDKFVRVNGKKYMGSLAEKLILLCTTKLAALDAYGMGVEMEGGKPGWYDALNGLPGMLGSSMAETYELKRMVEFTISALERNPGKVELFEELYDLVNYVNEIIAAEIKSISGDQLIMRFWNKINNVKETYRITTYDGISGKKKSVSTEELVGVLNSYNKVLEIGINKAKTLFDGVVPTYFYFEVEEYTEDALGIHPTKLKACQMPDFLEGPVRFLKLNDTIENKKTEYNKVKASGLYDIKLSMYKVNSALETASYEIGRCRAFTPGWLENESIWLHMEYKYLLEVLRAGLYEEFFEDFKNAAIPFLDPEIYGRSILENSSFIVSSSNPNEKIHGKGFVARLSGSTIEFISMWKHMMFGGQPFKMNDSELTLMFSPAMPKYLIPEDKIVSANFMGQTKVSYIFDKQQDYVPGNYSIKRYEIAYENGDIITVDGDVISAENACKIRDLQALEIRVYIQ